MWARQSERFSIPAWPRTRFLSKCCRRSERQRIGRSIAPQSFAIGETRVADYGIRSMEGPLVLSIDAGKLRWLDEHHLANEMAGDRVRVGRRSRDFCDSETPGL